MNSKLIKSDADLRFFLPNFFSPGKGDSPLIDKISAYIDQAEKFLFRFIIPEYIIDRLPESDDKLEIYNRLAKIVAAHALYLAVPALDICLTSSGFGIASTDSIAPASKHRVEELRIRLIGSRDFYIESATNYLFRFDDWESNPASDKFKTLLSLGNILGILESDFDGFLFTQPKIKSLEDEIASLFISHGVMKRLINARILSLNAQIDEEHLMDLEPVMVRVSSFMINRMKTFYGNAAPDPNADRDIIAAVDYIRNHPDIFPEWEGSHQAERFNRQPFQNTKPSGGFFF